MTQKGDVLVAIINNQLDFAIAHEQHWYRIPVRSQQRYLEDRWPPRWLKRSKPSPCGRSRPSPGGTMGGWT